MFQFEGKNVSSNISRFKIIIEKMENFDIEGILYNEFYGVAIDFQGIRQMLSRLDDFFDYVNFPQATHAARSFRDEPVRAEKQPPQGLREIAPEELSDRPATFLLHVQFRRNSTWQGTLEWISEKRTKRFRSELEMIGWIAETLQQPNYEGISL